MPEYGGSELPPLNKGAQDLYLLIREHGKPISKQDLQEKTKFAPRTIYNYIEDLLARTLIKEAPSYGRTKLYVSIDYVPVLDESRPLAQRWQVFSAANNKRFTLGELATHYADGKTPQSSISAEYLIKGPALLVYLAQDSQMSNEQKQKELDNLKEVLKQACEQLQSAIGAFNQMITDPRLWRPDLLDMFASSPDFVLNSVIPRLIERLREIEDDESFDEG